MVSFNPSTGSKYASSSTPHPFPSPQTHVREPPDYTHFFFSKLQNRIWNFCRTFSECLKFKSVWISKWPTVALRIYRLTHVSKTEHFFYGWPFSLKVPWEMKLNFNIIFNYSFSFHFFRPIWNHSFIYLTPCMEVTRLS